MPRAYARGASVVAQLGDQLALVLLGVAGESQLLRALLQLGHRPVVVRPGLTTLASHRRAPSCRCRVGDPRRLLLGVALVTQLLVQLLILQLRFPCRHVRSFRRCRDGRYPAWRGTPGGDGRRLPGTRAGRPVSAGRPARTRPAATPASPPARPASTPGGARRR